MESLLVSTSIYARQRENCVDWSLLGGYSGGYSGLQGDVELKRITSTLPEWARTRAGAGLSAGGADQARGDIGDPALCSGGAAVDSRMRSSARSEIGVSSWSSSGHWILRISSSIAFLPISKVG